MDPCNPSPCGSNAVCTTRGRAGSCQCIPDYFGDPYVACRPECVINSDCPASKQCRNLHCIDPCPGLCGTNANCKVANHIPVCVCNQGYIGDPFVSCRRPPTPGKIEIFKMKLFFLQMRHFSGACGGREPLRSRPLWTKQRTAPSGWDQVSV